MVQRRVHAHTRVDLCMYNGNTSSRQRPTCLTMFETLRRIVHSCFSICIYFNGCHLKVLTCNVGWQHPWNIPGQCMAIGMCSIFPQSTVFQPKNLARFFCAYLTCIALFSSLSQDGRTTQSNAASGYIRNNIGLNRLLSELHKVHRNRMHKIMPHKLTIRCDPWWKKY